MLGENPLPGWNTTVRPTDGSAQAGICRFTYILVEHLRNTSAVLGPSSPASTRAREYMGRIKKGPCLERRHEKWSQQRCSPKFGSQKLVLLVKRTGTAELHCFLSHAHSWNSALHVSHFQESLSGLAGWRTNTARSLHFSSLDKGSATQ